MARLDAAIGAYARRHESASIVASLHFPGRETLTRREREVLEQFTSGASNKEAGCHLLGGSVYTSSTAAESP